MVHMGLLSLVQFKVTFMRDLMGMTRATPELLTYWHIRFFRGRLTNA